MTSRHFKLAEEYVSIAKVTVGSPLSRLIPKLFGDEQPLPKKQCMLLRLQVNMDKIKTDTSFTILTWKETKRCVDQNVYFLLIGTVCSMLWDSLSEREYNKQFIIAPPRASPLLPQRLNSSKHTQTHLQTPIGFFL